MHIPEGASVAIVGKSGSGKSTLMHVMSGLDKPQVGEVLIERQDVLKMNDNELDNFRSDSIGFIFQSFYVDARESCYNNVGIVCEIAGVPLFDQKRLITRALEDVELTEKEKVMAGDLSGGEKQRLAIARAIVNKPKILFADEPTGNLDTSTGELIEDLLFRYNKDKGVTLVVVTHDMDLAKRCDMIIRIQDGKIISTIENQHIEVKTAARPKRKRTTKAKKK
jgi:putative ABC transport system ATP-binding protein